METRLFSELRGFYSLQRDWRAAPNSGQSSSLTSPGIEEMSPQLNFPRVEQERLPDRSLNPSINSCYHDFHAKKKVHNYSPCCSRMERKETRSYYFRCWIHARAPSSGAFTIWHRNHSRHCLTIWLFQGTMWTQMKPSMVSLSKSSFCECGTNVPSLFCTCCTAKKMHCLHCFSDTYNAAMIRTAYRWQCYASKQLFIT